MTPTQQRMRNFHTHTKMLESGAIGTLGHLLNGTWLVKINGVLHRTCEFGSGRNQFATALRRNAEGLWESDPSSTPFLIADIPVSLF